MDLHLIHGATVRLYHQSQPYRNHLICPTQHKDETLLGFVILTPEGEVDHQLAGKAKYTTIEDAIAAAKALVDHTCTYWTLDCVLEEWEQSSLISGDEAAKVRKSLDEWDNAYCAEAYGL